MEIYIYPFITTQEVQVNIMEQKPIILLLIQKNFAENINKSLVDCYNNILFKGIEGDYNRGAKYNDYTVILERENPSVLVEVGYVDNPVSFNKLIDPDYQKILAESIIKGIEDSL